MVSRHLNRQNPPTWSEFLSSPKALLFVVLVLSLIGLFFVFEASVADAFTIFNDQYHFLKKQSLHLLIGLVAMLISYHMPSTVWRKFSPVAYVGGIIALVLAFIPGLGQEINGAYRWVFIGPFNFQPIEIMKFAVTIFYAAWMCRHQRLGPFLFLTAVPAGLVMLQPDLGSTLILLSIAAGLYFAAGGKIKPFLGVGALGILLLSLLIMVSPYRRQRLTTFLNPESDPLGASFHVRQITLALGNGGILGQGIGNSRQKFSYIPEANTDSIFAIVAEEIGFVGSCIILFLFSLFIFISYRLIQKHEGASYEKLVAIGALIWISTQTILNISAVVALVPLTGVPLPFFSYGGSSLVMVLFATGLILHLHKGRVENQA